jgi:hypothetical protein
MSWWLTASHSSLVPQLDFQPRHHFPDEPFQVAQRLAVLCAHNHPEVTWIAGPALGHRFRIHGGTRAIVEFVGRRPHLCFARQIVDRLGRIMRWRRLSFSDRRRLRPANGFSRETTASRNMIPVSGSLTAAEAAVHQPVREPETRRPPSTNRACGRVRSRITSSLNLDRAVERIEVPMFRERPEARLTHADATSG